MNQQEFERLVAEALDSLPIEFHEQLDNVEVVVEGWPDAETMRLAGVRHRAIRQERRDRASLDKISITTAT